MTLKTIFAAIALTGAVSISLVACSGPAEETRELIADYPGYETVAEATGVAELVIEGEFVGSKVEKLYPDIVETGDEETNPQQGVELSEADLEEMAVVTTVSEVRVTEVLKGDVKVGDVIKVSQLGGTLDDVKYVDSATTLLSTLDASTVLLFLNDQGDSYDLINPEQGLYTVEGEKVTPVASAGKLRDLSSVDDIREAVKEEGE